MSAKRALLTLRLLPAREPREEWRELVWDLPRLEDDRDEDLDLELALEGRREGCREPGPDFLPRVEVERPRDEGCD